MRNGRAASINENIWSQTVNTFQQLFITGVSVPGSLKGVQTPLYERYMAEQIYNVRYAVMDPTYPLISPTAAERGTELSSIITDAMVQYVMGQINDAQYQAAIERWRAQGGQQIINEYNQAWRANR
jgi:putative aldouronate transport system substrate-binding protein